MKIIFCVDDNMGLMFNNRRQSQDSELRKRVINKLSDAKLFMNEYTGKQFELVEDERIIISNDFLEKAKETDFCFIENSDISSIMEKIERIILYRWNRKYPADKKFPIDLSHDWILETSEEFAGSSHEKITEETYIKDKI